MQRKLKYLKYFHLPFNTGFLVFFNYHKSYFYFHSEIKRLHKDILLSILFKVHSTTFNRHKHPFLFLFETISKVIAVNTSQRIFQSIYYQLQQTENRPCISYVLKLVAAFSVEEFYICIHIHIHIALFARF